jgi:hypothetical protein
MGIRLNRRLGFGFNNVELNDSRFNALPNYGKKDIADYQKFLEKTTLPISQSRDDYSSLGFGWGDETTLDLHKILGFGLPDDDFVMDNGKGFFVITPPLIAEESYRFDDGLDWEDYYHYYPKLAEETIGSSYILDHCPFPYSTNLIDKITKEEIISRPAIDYLKDKKNIYGIEHTLARTPYSTLEELETKTKLVPPIALRSFTSWLNIFKEPDTWEDMKPIVVTYFS